MCVSVCVYVCVVCVCVSSVCVCVCECVCVMCVCHVCSVQYGVAFQVYVLHHNCPDSKQSSTG